MKSFFKVIAFFVLSAFATLCSAQGILGNSTGYNQYQEPITVKRAIVLGVRDVQLTTQGTQQQGSPNVQQVLGGALGGVIGGLLGRKSGDYTIMAATASLGTMVGAVVTAAPTVRAAQEIVYLVEGAQSPVAITQAVADGVRFAQGQQVMVLGQGRIAPMF